jgi:hypothetical protein
VPLLVGLLVGLLSASPSPAIQLRAHSATVDELRKGTLAGVSVSSRGRLALAPVPERLGDSAIPGGAAHVWAIASDTAGNVFLGTGPDGRILRLGAGGAEKLVFTVDDPIVTALAFTPGGDLLAGTGPGGKIWRVRPDGTGSVWCETGERYVWSLLVAPDGAVFAGTGEEGVVLRIDRAGTATPLFDSEDAHIVQLARSADGALLAAGAGRGLVYRIGLDGHATVLYDDDLPEIADLAVQQDGGLLVIALAPAPADPRPPAVRLRLPDGTAATPEAMTGFDEGSRATLQGVIEGLPEVGEGSRTRGRLVRIAPDGVASELWRSSTEAPYALAAAPDGGALLGTGEPARLYRVGPDGEVALLATLREGQVTGFAGAAGTPVFATSNPASAYRLPGTASGRGSFTSFPIDAGGIARWGHLRWDAGAGVAGVEMATRTGNSEQPDASWSSWAPAPAGDAAPSIASPEGRFLQWRLTLRGGEDSPAVSGVAVSFAARNRPPLLRDFRPDPPVAQAAGKEAVFRWAVADPDGDPLDVQVQYRPRGGTSWQTGARVTAEDPSADAEGMRKDGRLVWDTSAVPEGPYEVRGHITDQPANPEGRGKEASSEPIVLQVDRTPPEVSLEREQDGSWRLRVVDAASGGGRVEVLERGVVLFAASPEDGVADSAQETYRLPASSAEPRVLKVTDAAGNVVERPLSER